MIIYIGIITYTHPIRNGVTNIPAICTEFYEKSIAVGLKQLKYHSEEEQRFPLSLFREKENWGSGGGGY